MLHKTAIYGAGAFGKLFFQALDKKIDFFIDDFADSSHYEDKKIKHLNEVAKHTKIYISVMQSSGMIKQKLLKLGYTNVLGFTESISDMPEILRLVAKTNYLWLVADNTKMVDDAKIATLRELLKDQKSKKLLDQMVLLRKTLDIKHYIKPYDKEYFPSDVPILEQLHNINFVDCGAYTGDTIKDLMQHTSSVKTTISFEPDLSNLQKLNLELHRQKELFEHTEFFVYPAGVYDRSTTLRFANDGIDSSASISDDASVSIQVVSLDDVLCNVAADYIKMNIEGAEKQALLGATKTLQKYKPNLAICLYHKPEDLWELPLLIKQIEPSYDMYLRVHEDMCLSTVLYCISTQR